MISLVIPVHNEEPVLPLLLQSIYEAAPEWNDDYEIVMVDDGSTDESYSLMIGAASRDPRLRIIKLSRNFGHQAAISAGMRHAVGAVVIIIDADLQDPPAEIVRFLAKWREGYHVVYGIRTARKEAFPKRAAYALFYRALHAISDINIPLDAGDFCLMDRKVIDALNNLVPEQVRFVRGLRAYVGFKQIGLVYARHPRAAGTASYDTRRLLKLAIDGLFGFSMLPLRLASYVGFLIAIPSFLVGTYFIVQRMFRSAEIFGYRPTQIPGIATLAVGLFFLSGVILIILGIIGEYLGRIYIEVKRRPQYIEESVYEASADRRPREAETEVLRSR
jgi:polyisoprenyl-phosphate glycosyltransferase